MRTRQLKREDLPYQNSDTNSLHIPVIHNGGKKFICDIHFGNNSLCYLENTHGKPTPIADIFLIYNLYHKGLRGNILIYKNQLTWLRYSVHSQQSDWKERVKKLEEQIHELQRILLCKPFHPKN